MNTNMDTNMNTKHPPRIFLRLGAKRLPDSMNWFIAGYFDAALAEGLCVDTAVEVVRIIRSNFEVTV